MMPGSIGVNLRVTGHCSQGGRKYMEDFFSVAYQQSLSDGQELEYAFIGIYDGHGGSEAATFAKENLINEIVNQKSFWSNNDELVLQSIRDGYISTHNAMKREQKKWPKTSTGYPSTAGTTASVAFIRNGKIYIGHVGDSGIVLGYQHDGENIWRAKRLTQDHKPESPMEKHRISSSGGKVVEKAGVCRVVWRRAKLGHQGPIRRSTHVDEIPFLAVARSLGDLWSYNSELNEFVVSPEPDIRVIKIDPKTFRCLIFGTDGLWNVVKPEEAVYNVQQAEQTNQRNFNPGGPREWTNPSKALVDKALESWALSKFRADNTSVVIIMLDPPGPPRRDVLRSYSTSPYPHTEYLPNLLQPVENQVTVKPDPIENFTVFDHRTNEHINLDMSPAPTSGTVVLKRTIDSECSDGDEYQSASGKSTVSEQGTDNPSQKYSYFESKTEVEKSCIFTDDQTTDPVQNSNEYQSTHTIQSQADYRLTKLETRSEQQIKSQRVNVYGESSNCHQENHASAYNGYYESHNYMTIHQEPYASTSSGYTSTEFSDVIQTNNPEYNQRQLPVESSLESSFQDINTYDSVVLNENDTNVTVFDTIQSEANENDSNEDTPSKYDIADQSIQINEISSSNNDIADQTNDIHPSVSSKQPTTNSSANNPTIERKITRSTAAKSNQLRRSLRYDLKSKDVKTIINVTKRLITRKHLISSSLQKSTKQMNHKENILSARKTRPDQPIVGSTTMISTRTRSVASSAITNDCNPRTLRSKNTLSKDVKRLNGQPIIPKRIHLNPSRQHDAKPVKRPIFTKSARNEGKNKITVQTIKNIKNNNNNNVPIINHNVVVTRSTRAMHN